MPPSKRTKRRQRGDHRGYPRDGSRNNHETSQNNKKINSDYPFPSWDQKKKQLQSLRFPTVGIIVLIFGALEFQIDSGIIDGLNAFFTGFLCTSTMIEWRTNSKGKRRKTNNSYFYITLFIIRILIGLMNFVICKRYYGEYNAQVTSFKLTLTVIGSFIGSEVIKQNEFVGGIFGSFVGLVGSVIAVNNYNFLSQFRSKYDPSL